MMLTISICLAFLMSVATATSAGPQLKQTFMWDPVVRWPRAAAA